MTGTMQLTHSDTHFHGDGSYNPSSRAREFLTKELWSFENEHKQRVKPNAHGYTFIHGIMYSVVYTCEMRVCIVFESFLPLFTS